MQNRNANAQTVEKCTAFIRQCIEEMQVDELVVEKDSCLGNVTKKVDATMSCHSHGIHWCITKIPNFCRYYRRRTMPGTIEIVDL